MIIAVDFDGTLCTDEFPNIGEPNISLIKKLQYLSLQGHRLILWTCRCGDELQAALDWCDRQKLFFDAVNDNVYITPAVFTFKGMLEVPPPTIFLP